MKKGKLTVAQASLSRACILGIGISVVILLSLALVAALLISNEKIDISTSSYIAGAAQFVAAFVGCLITGKLIKERTFVACLIVVAGCVFVQLAAALLFFNGISVGMIAGLLANVAGCGGAILLCIGKNNRSVIKRRKAHSR